MEQLTELINLIANLCSVISIVKKKGLSKEENKGLIIHFDLTLDICWITRKHYTEQKISM